MKGDDISERLLDFGARVVKVTEALPRRIASKHIAVQLLKCGTSAGANYEEGRAAESKADFIHKLSVAWKEAREAGYWLRLIKRCEFVKPQQIVDLLQEAIDLAAILGKSVKTAKAKKEKNRGNERNRMN